MRGAHSLRASGRSAWSGDWYWALPMRPPTRMSCTAWRQRVAPAMRTTFRRRRGITSSAGETAAGGAVMGGEQVRAHHRGGGERDPQRDEDRHREHDRELAEEAPDQTAHQEDRDEDRDQRDADREHGEPDLARALDRRLERGHARLEMAHDVLHHHDGGVHHEA